MIITISIPLSLTLALCFSQLLQAQEINSIEDLQSVIDSGRILSADEVFNRLPMIMKERPALVTHGEGNQKGSSERPRMLMAKPDGRFYVGFLTDETHQAYNEAEFAQLNSANELDFYLFRNGALQKNPKQCMYCHQLGAKRHLRIEQYPQWSGWLGISVHTFGRLRELDIERIGILMKAKPEIARLRHLALDLSVPDYYNVWPMHDNASRFNLIAMKTLGKVLFESVRRHARYHTLKYALAVPLVENAGHILQSLLSPSDYRQYTKDRRSLIQELNGHKENLKTYVDKLFTKVYGVPWKHFIALVPNLQNVDEDPVFVEWALRQMGDSLSNYSTSGTRPSPVLNDGFGGEMGTGIIRVIRIQILKDISGNSEIAAPFSYVQPEKYDGLIEVVSDQTKIRPYATKAQAAACTQVLIQ
ncbi:MAG: hypothetical protein IPL83_07855 [Bdellovibrionales bacterium]|nr:hypothetical protein [Bdellovibrionales bacterium]